MQKTSNYNLNQWESTDPIRREDFNSDNAAIDAAIKAVESAMADKADTATVTTQLAACGNCRIVIGSYTGNGKYGSSNPVKLTFGFKPLLVLVGSDEYASYSGNPSVLIRGRASAAPCMGAGNGEYSLMKLTWSNSAVSWYNADSEIDQNNEEFIVYRYVALGLVE